MHFYVSSNLKRPKLRLLRVGILFTVIWVLTSFTAIAQESSLWEREALLDDWGGLRSNLSDNGIVSQLRFTQFYQGLTAGDGNPEFEYGGKFDLLLNADASKLGFWDGLSLTVHGEANVGETANNRGGTLLPVNTALFFPGIEGSDRYDLTSVFFGQKISDRTNLILGKINMIDIAAGHPFMGGAGIDSFQNIAFAAPPSGLVPPYIFGGLMNIRADWARFTLAAYDPEWVTNRTGLEHPFREGVTFLGGIDTPVEIAGRTGTQGLKAAASTSDGTDLRDLPQLILPPEAREMLRTKEEPYFVSYVFDQYIVQNPENPRQGWGIFGQIGFTDSNPTPIDWFALIGIGGNGFAHSGGTDRFGIGFFHYSLSDDLKDPIKPIVELDDEEGIEVFYNRAFTPWMSISADLQVIDPTDHKSGTATLFGLRTKIIF